MRGVIGLVSLLLALVVVGLLVTRQLKATGQVHQAGVTTVGTAASATPRERGEQTQQRVRDDVAKALEQGAAARREQADQ